MQRYRTTRLINQRYAPVNNTADKSNIVTTVAKGYIFESTGSTVNDLGVWYRDMNNLWYWGGGVEKAGNIDEAREGYPDWMNFLRLPDIWQLTTGKGVGVAVIDTGIHFGNNDLPFSSDVYYLSDSCLSLEDKNGHGSHCAGLIGARNSTETKIGVAPDCNLYICKINDTIALGSDKRKLEYAKAIRWCTQRQEIKIISVSWDSFIDDKYVINEIQASVNAAIQAGKIVVVARKNINYSSTDPSLTYPSCCSGVISTGIIPADKNFNFKGHKNILVPGSSITSYNQQGQLLKMSGTSMSTAIMAGITGLIIEKKGPHITATDLLKNIIPLITSQQISDGELVNVIDGTLLYNYLKN